MADISAHFSDQLAMTHRRLDAHDGRLGQLEVQAAAEKVRSRNIEESLAAIQSGITWITRLVIGGIVAGAIAFVVSGGLNVAS